MNKLIEILPMVLHATAVGGERVATRYIGPRGRAIRKVGAHVESKFKSEAPVGFHRGIQSDCGLTRMVFGLPECLSRHLVAGNVVKTLAPTYYCGCGNNSCYIFILHIIH